MGETSPRTGQHGGTTRMAVPRVRANKPTNKQTRRTGCFRNQQLW